MTEFSQRLLSIAGAAILLLPAISFAEPEPTDESPLERIQITIANRSVNLENDTLRVTEGNKIELVWTTDEDVELHLHGYDIELEVSPGEPALMAFEAYATGRFQVTSHAFGGADHGHKPLMYLEVYPR